jgi:hypothetical protein
MGFLAISVIILVLAGIWVYDRRQRRKGHVFRSPGDMMSAERQQRRSATGTRSSRPRLRSATSAGPAITIQARTMA